MAALAIQSRMNEKTLIPANKLVCRNQGFGMPLKAEVYFCIMLIPFSKVRA